MAPRKSFWSFVVVAAALASGACTTAGGGGGGAVQSVGGPAGAACNPQFHNEGCHTVQGQANQMTCDPATSKWTLKASCPAQHFCAETTDPAQAPKKLTECKPIPQQTGGTDTVGGGGDGIANNPDTQPGQDAITQPDTPVGEDVVAPPDAVDDTGPVKDVVIVGDTQPDTQPDTKPTWGPLVSCAIESCPDQAASCLGNPLCVTAAQCIDACGASQECALNCINTAPGPVSSMLLNLVQCAVSQGCTGGTQPVCGDGKCEGVESDTCPSDCSKPPVCGNGTCEVGETKTSCAKDCGTTTPVCGNGTCESGETASSCAKDCGLPPPVCGNGKCEGGETANNCPLDCGGGGPVCGNGKCESGETASNCAKDCGGTGSCGDGVCGAGETDQNCAPDCDPATKCLFQVCGTELNACFGNEKCAGMFQCFQGCAENQSCLQNCFAAAGSQAQQLYQAFAACAQGSGCSEGGGGGTAGCTESSSPKCGGCACEACVCAKDPYCCQTAWDGACVSQCQQDCGMKCP